MEDANPLDAALAPEPATEEPTAQAPAAETPPGPARGPDGKFAAKETAEAPEAAPASPQARETAPEARPEPSHAPLAALLDERDRRQAAEAQLADLRREAQAWKAANQPPATPESQLAAQQYATNLRFSRRFAEREYGKEAIAQVHAWAEARCDADPFFNEQMRLSEDPYEAAWQAYNRDQIAAKVSPERLAAFEAWEQAQAELQAAPAAQTHQSADPPPRSLAHAPGTGLAGQPPLEIDEGAAFRSAIG